MSICGWQWWGCCCNLGSLVDLWSGPWLLGWKVGCCLVLWFCIEVYESGAWGPYFVGMWCSLWHIVQSTSFPLANGTSQGPSSPSHHVLGGQSAHHDRHAWFASTMPGLVEPPPYYWHPSRGLALLLSGRFLSLLVAKACASADCQLLELPGSLPNLHQPHSGTLLAGLVRVAYPVLPVHHC